MKAAFIESPGSAQNFIIGELPEPSPKPSELKIKVSFSSINPIDTYIRGGLVPMELPCPFVPGCDFAGEVVECGSNIKDFNIGDRVWGSNQGLLGRQGTLSEFITVDSIWAYKAPKNVQDDQLAATALVGITTAIGLLKKARVRNGEKLLISGGAGAIGSMVIQMAKAIGMEVIATTSSLKKQTHCLNLGADHALDYTADSFEQDIKKVNQSGFDVIWETSRNPDLEFAIMNLAESGRMVLMAGRDALPQFPVGPFYVKGCSLFGFAMFKTPAPIQRECAKLINKWVESGEIAPFISHTFSLNQVSEAHALQEKLTLKGSPTPSGKIVIKIN